MIRANRATFFTAATDKQHFPKQTLPEIAFIGRSNVGKSTLINALTNTNNLARTSRTPGRTRQINWFHITPSRGSMLAFVDLPGFGYAKISKQERSTWQTLVQNYLERDIYATLLLIDVRRHIEIEESDLLSWLSERNIPIIPVITKADKLSKSKQKPASMALQHQLNMKQAPVLFSSLSKEGIQTLWHRILSISKPNK